ncbi:MAG: Mannosylfructose-phosphate synthase [candidate division WS2 bacterium ADurb.Bin280]|uniref:Mannosylfructose-phosphate synthase n=1 Tax=candidate division WS2 bacterium ADurb.Bin280 TaxID=1852829 RepID=A0A1V5SD55_9BACT|nr:MAG: Mannosylfructose-phosphate synthase [candidate division WS2 bacterium ADurb.Bin280]
MKIAIDTQTTLGQPTGFGFYVSNLVENLKENGAQNEFVLISPDTSKDFSTPERFIWDQYKFPRLAKNHGAQIIHQPCFSAPMMFSGEVVVTIHDIISILFPQNIPFASRIFYSKWMPFSYRKAKQIISISHSTKADIVRVLKIPSDKITVIHNGYDSRLKKPAGSNDLKIIRDKYNLENDYLLHVGTLEPRKNLNFLIDVFFEVIKDPKNKNLSLVITGKKGWYYEGLFEKVEKLNLKDKVIFTGYIDEKDKAALYQGAKIFTFPSLYEGFGLPPLEAMACGVPVISSDTSSMPEVIGDAGILISPRKKSAWIEAITKLNRDSSLYREMQKKNIEQVSKFDWKQTARKTIEIYEKCLTK